MADEMENATRRSRVNWLIWPVALLGLLAAGTYAYQRYQYDAEHIVTDNAQVQGRMVKILAPERGFITNVLAVENQRVAQDALLAEQENRYYQLEVERAQAKLNALQASKGDEKIKNGGGLSEAKLATAQANLEVVQAQLSEAEANAKQNNDKLERMQSARVSPTFVQSQLDMAKANADQTNARLLTLQKEAFAAQQEVQEAMANSQLLDYNIQQAKAELAQAKLNLAATEIKSPINGHVAQLALNPGMMVEEGQYLMTIVSDDDKWLVANIKETKFEQLKIGDLVDITVDAFPGTDFKGVVASFSPAAGNQFSIIPRNYASGNFIKVEALIPVLIQFTEPVNEVEKLVPGMSAEVKISIAPMAPKPAASKPAKAPKEEAKAGSEQPDKAAKPEPAEAASTSATDASPSANGK